jgi:acid phosphatase type 7
LRCRPTLHAAAVLVAALAVLVVGCAGPARPAGTTPTAASTGGVATADSTTLVAAGDVACAPSVEVADRQCQQEATAELVEGLNPVSVLVLGDTAYETVDAETLKGYDASWGRFLDRTHAVVGNHEYYGGGPDAYWGYFGDRAGPRDEGWYSYDVGAWHVVVLNSECGEVDCATDGDQGEWLAEDLAAHSARCTLAAFHRPRFSSGEEYGDDESVSGFWQVLQDAGVDVVLNGHEHSYERFAPQRESGRATAEEGMAEFVVGTGGRDLRGFGETKPNSAVRWNDAFGVLALTLRTDGYDWRFHATDGADVDAGSATCR